MTRTTAKPWSTQAATVGSKASWSWSSGPPCSRNTAGCGPGPASGTLSRAWMRPPGPSTHRSRASVVSGGTRCGAGKPGSASRPRNRGGRAELDHSSQASPSGRVRACSIVPAGVSSRVSSPPRTS
ncbi:hypothetical protein ACFQ2B_07290 [Streptomyces stramineus]